MPATTLLARDVHLCIVDGIAIFLDLASDRYVGLDATQTKILQGLTRNENDSDSDAAALVKHLVQENLLTREARNGKPLRCADGERARSALMTGEYDPPCNIRVSHVLALTAAYVRVRASLRLRSLAGAIDVLYRRQHTTDDRPLDRESVRSLIFVCRRLRPLFYRARENCLLDSLVLTAFLQAHGVFPRLVFGVTNAPFSAHCWLQHGGVALNDRIEYVSNFTPIMTA
jgi:hypothetical protein